MGTLLRLTDLAAGDAVRLPAEETLFRVLEGPGSWLSALEVDGEGQPDNGSAWFQEIFAAPDARPLADSARYLFKIEIDVHDDVDLDAFHEWYNGTHVPEVNPAGLLGGRRFRALSHERRFLATYDLAHRHVMESDALARVRGFAQFTDGVTIRHRSILERTSR
ncbi:hypothetical protein [Pseudonocardia acaciae]|uniref:hypothetical protein n=1 Tax=Pseudonocardia acaciae TaxID=551276 RepID=UPI00048A9022|nr:hypothetical protein [Pseudonocardia acaciae]